MEPAEVKSSTYIDFDEKNNKEDHKFQVGDHVRISKYKNIFATGYVPNWSEEAFVIIKVKNNVLLTYFIGDLNGEKICGTLYGKNANKKSIRTYDIKSN